MKTIRTNCFETNSSSTHSFTVSAPTDLTRKPTQTFLPNEEGVIGVTLNTSDPDDGLLGKLTFLLSAAYHLGDQAAYDRVMNVVRDFTKLEVKVTANVWNNNSWKKGPVTAVLAHKDEDERDEHVEDEFYAWVREYGHGSVSEFVDEVNKIVESEQAILVFIFTNHSAFGRESHYD